jgi:hypothetical protein
VFYAIPDYRSYKIIVSGLADDRWMTRLEEVRRRILFLTMFEQNKFYLRGVVYEGKTNGTSGIYYWAGG